MSITEFLQARIAEDETLARAALIGIHGEHKTSRDYAGYVLSSERDTTETQDQFIETFWPARILAECEAKRAIVAECLNVQANPWDYADAIYTAEVAVYALAAVYSEHPDYQQEWKVGA